jgi:hypothetical protein
MRVLIACEESQEVCKAFRALGHEAYSCDILPCSGGHPKWHIQGDAQVVIMGGYFVTQSGELVYIERWDAMIAFPPCTYICTGAQSNITRRPYLNVLQKRENIGIPFFMKMVDAPIELIAVENPIGVMSTRYRKPDQIIRPFMFGHEYNKDVCLWLKGLPKLVPTSLHPGPYKKLDFWSTKRNPGGVSLKSKTFPGIARAMAEQWGKQIINEKAA